MTNRHSTKHALLTSLMALLLCFTMLLGTTYAWFTDSVTSAGNKIQAGTLDIELYMLSKNDAGELVREAISERTEPIFGANSLVAQNNAADTLWEPGKTQVVYFSLKNNGNLALMYKVDLIVSQITKALNEVVLYTITPLAEDTLFSLTQWDGTNALKVADGINETEAKDVMLTPGQENFFALSVHMDENAGNQYQGGTITFDMVVYASQIVAEADSFDNTYDESAPFLKSGYGNGTPNGGLVEFALYDRDPEDHNAQKVANVKVNTSDMVDPDLPVSSTVIASPSVYETVVVNSDQGAQTFNISMSNVKDGAEVVYELRVGTGLTGVSFYHYGSPVPGAYYDGEYIIFTTDDFSPFTVVYDAEVTSEGDSEVEIDTTEPKAIVTEEAIPANFDWNNVGGFYPAAGNDQKLDVVYKFAAPHTTETVANSAYKEWCCDYYVMLKSDTLATLPAGSITLGGNYGTFNWVGFDNPTVDTNTWIPLLGSAFGDCDETGAMVDPYWTYERVIALVETFLCGVGEANGNTTDLAGAEFVVELRLTNPNNHAEQIVANQVTYTFPAK